MDKIYHHNLSRRERQIMDAIYLLGEASVADVLEEIPDPPGYNSVRVTLTILERKGHLKHKKEGQKYIYHPVFVSERARRSVLKHVLSTFFEDSTPKVLSTLLDMSAAKLTEKEMDELSRMIQNAKKERSE